MPVKIKAINCKGLVEKFITDQQTKKNILTSFGTSGGDFLCPDIESYYLFKPDWMDFSYQTYASLSFHVYKNEISDVDIANAYIRAVYMFPYYNPAEYRETGQLSWSSKEREYAYFDVTGDNPQSIIQDIYRRNIRIYNNLWFDISSLYWLQVGNSETIYETGIPIFRYHQQNEGFSFLF